MIDNVADQTAQRIDRADLFDLVREERFARDRGQWERLKNCYTDDSRVRVTWFLGSGREFAEASVKQTSGPSIGRHLIIPMDARVVGDRAVVESDGMIQVRMKKDGVEFDSETCCRWISWARRTAAGWKLVTFDCVHFKDALHVLNPAESLPLDWESISKSRPTYRFLDFLLRASGYETDQNLAGVDRPDTVAALNAEADAWLSGKLDSPPWSR